MKIYLGIGINIYINFISGVSIKKPNKGVNISKTSCETSCEQLKHKAQSRMMQRVPYLSIFSILTQDSTSSFSSQE